MDEKKSTGSNRIALAALLVSLLSMIGTVGNFLYGIYSRQRTEELGLAIRCDVDPVAKVRLIKAETEIAVDSAASVMAVGPGALKSKPPFTTYPSFLVFDANCRITNISTRKIAIESITASAVFGHGGGIQDRAISRGVVDLTNNAPQFPRLLEQGEQAIYKIYVGRPLPSQLQHHFEAIFDGKAVIYAIDARIPERATGTDDKLVPSLRIEVASGEHKSYVEQSATTGRAGGLKNVNRSKRLGNLPPPEGGGYSWNMINWSRRLSSSRCFWMYSRMLASSRPTVET